MHDYVEIVDLSDRLLIAKLRWWTYDADVAFNKFYFETIENCIKILSPHLKVTFFKKNLQYNRG